MPFFVAYLILVHNYLTPNKSNPLINLVGVGCILILSIILQFVTQQENSTLYNQIRIVLNQTRLQAEELSEINHTLQIEVVERKRAEEQLSHDAMHDWLTGLPNRLLFSDRLERAIEYTQRRNNFPCAVFFLDLDYFKVINDSLGHHIGDQLLISIANRLNSCLRSSDTVARLGGDEFVLLIENPKGSDTIRLVTERILRELNEPVLINGQELHITASIGIVMSVEGYQCPDDVLRDADIAMYQAKALGKARVEIFNPDLRSRAVSRLELENDMRRALEQGEFFLHYQPIIDLVSNQMTGVEALVRWKHPRRGVLLPMEFIPVAEETGLMIPLGKWILLEACTQLKRWQTSLADAQKMEINVNISGKQLLQADFVETVRTALAATNLSPSSLKLEITESILINNYEEANHKFAELNELGIQLEIDDFGTGYSSLSYLQRFPIHTVKIDKSFVHDMSISEKGSDLIRTMITMARDMGMEAIAEGVETPEQLQELQDLMCHYGQGYLLCRPIDAQGIEKYIKNQSIVQEIKRFPGNRQLRLFSKNGCFSKVGENYNDSPSN